MITMMRMDIHTICSGIAGLGALALVVVQVVWVEQKGIRTEEWWGSRLDFRVVWVVAQASELDSDLKE
jgi:hypothetical protein